MIQISAAVTDKFGSPVVVPTMYLEILDSTGKPYWRLSPIVRDASTFAKLISTNEMKHNTRYIVRVGINRKLSPHGYDFFKTRNRKLVPLFIPLVFTPFVITPLIPKEARKPLFLTYKTELDARVCPICKPNEGLVFPIDSPDVIRIGPPDLGGETHYNCRCHYDISVAVNAALAQIQRQLRAVRPIMAILAVQKHLQKMGPVL